MNTENLSLCQLDAACCSGTVRDEEAENGDALCIGDDPNPRRLQRLIIAFSIPEGRPPFAVLLSNQHYLQAVG